jgi:hypothetical protein
VSAAPLLTLIAIAAIWPLGRDRDRDRDREESFEPTGTIKDLERRKVAVDANSSIVGGEA